MKEFLNKEGFDNHLGYKVMSFDETHAHLTLDIKKHHTNLYGYVHGGVYYSLSDAACGFIVTSFDETWVTLNGSIQYIKAAKEGRLDIKAKRLSQSRNTANIEVRVYQDNILCTHGTFTMYRIG